MQLTSRGSPRLALLLACTVMPGLAVLPGRAVGDDAYPQGALAFFDLDACPSGWAPAKAANSQPLNGYFLVPFAQPVTAGKLGTTVGKPLASGEDRTHTHTFSSSVSLTNMEFAAAAYCGGAGLCAHLTPSGAQDFSGTTDAGSAGVPYIQYLLCEKTTFHHNTNPPEGIPQYLVAFFETDDCPTGWKPTATTTGRLIVALPAAGTPGISFGGTPLAVGEDRTHTHGFSGQVTISSQSVAAATGCCDDGWGKQSTYDFSGTTDPASTGLPYVIVSQCQTCLPGDADPACLGKAE